MKNTKRHAKAICFGLFLSCAAYAQEPKQFSNLIPDALIPDAMADAASSGSVSTVAVTKPVNAAVKPLTARWLDLKTLSHSERYRNAYGTSGVRNFDSGQERSLIEGRIKLDAEGRYAIGFRASSGRYFNWAYSNYSGRGFAARFVSQENLRGLPADQYAAIIAAAQVDYNGGLALSSGLQSNGWEFYMRELYVSATPVKPVSIEFGSFGIERGLSTEITTFDEDGYLSGERIRVRDPKHLFFDQVGYTNAFFGHIAIPNLFARGSDLEEFNYRQAFFDKRLNARLAFSGEYTWQIGTPWISYCSGSSSSSGGSGGGPSGAPGSAATSSSTTCPTPVGAHTLRQAVVVGTKELKLIDAVRMETYERLNTVQLQGQDVKGDSGFAVSVDKKLGKLSGDFGFASIDKGYSVYSGSRLYYAAGFSLNGDTYGQGKRPFAHASYKVTPSLSAFGFYTHAVGAKDPTINQQGLNAGLSLDLKALVNAEKLVF